MTRRFQSVNYFIQILYIYKSRARDVIPTLAGYKKDVQMYCALERYIYKNNFKLEDFKKEWQYLGNALENY